MKMIRHSWTRALSAGAFVTLVALTWPALAEDERCISVSKNDYTSSGADMGVATVQWQAELTNRCNMSYDADLEIKFVDEDENVIYKSSDLLSVPRHGTSMARREFNIPGPDFERVKDVRVVIVAERERPF